MLQAGSRYIIHESFHNKCKISAVCGLARSLERHDSAQTVIKTLLFAYTNLAFLLSKKKSSKTEPVHINIIFKFRWHHASGNS